MFRFKYTHDVEVPVRSPHRLLLLSILERSLRDLKEPHHIRHIALHWFLAEDVEEASPRGFSYRDVKETVLLTPSYQREVEKQINETLEKYYRKTDAGTYTLR